MRPANVLKLGCGRGHTPFSERSRKSKPAALNGDNCYAYILFACIECAGMTALKDLTVNASVVSLFRTKDELRTNSVHCLDPRNEEHIGPSGASVVSLSNPGHRAHSAWVNARQSKWIYEIGVSNGQLFRLRKPRKRLVGRRSMLCRRC
jgi:hypothetical protein